MWCAQSERNGHGPRRTTANEIKKAPEVPFSFDIGGEGGIVRGCAAHPSLTLGTASAKALRRPSPMLRIGSSNPLIPYLGFESPLRGCHDRVIETD